jgi:hypothetical protein
VVIVIISRKEKYKTRIVMSDGVEKHGRAENNPRGTPPMLAMENSRNHPLLNTTPPVRRKATISLWYMYQHCPTDQRVHQVEHVSSYVEQTKVEVFGQSLGDQDNIVELMNHPHKRLGIQQVGP